MTSFDLEQVYDDKIAPLMSQIIAICHEHELPVFASFLYRHNSDDDENGFVTTHLPGPFKEFDPHFSRCVDIVRRGLPENRIQAFTITTKKEGA